MKGFLIRKVIRMFGVLVVLSIVLCSCRKNGLFLHLNRIEGLNSISNHKEEIEEPKKTIIKRITRALSEDALNDARIVLHSGAEDEYIAAGLSPDADHTRIGAAASGAFDSSVRNLIRIPLEYQSFNYVCLWVFVEWPFATAAHLRLNCLDEEGMNSYLRYSFSLDWQGWKQLIVPVDAFVRQLGKNPDITTLKSIELQFGGYDNGEAVEEGTVVYVDSLFLATDLYEYEYAADTEINDSCISAIKNLRSMLKTTNALADSLITTDIDKWIRTICKDSSLNNSSDMTSIYELIYSAAWAYSDEGEEYYHNRDLLEAIIDALDYMDQNYLSQRNRVKFTRDSWWDWEIGAPTAIVNTLVILSDAMGEENIYRLLKSVDAINCLPVRTAANRLSIGYCAMVSALLQKDYRRVIDCREILAESLGYVTFEVGFYEDGSYIDHLYIPYNGTYGCVYISNMAKLITALYNTIFAFDMDTVNKCIKNQQDSFIPFLFHGAMSASVRGRSIFRSSSRDLSYGIQAIESMIMLYSIAEEDSDREILKGAILDGYSANKWLYRRKLSEYALNVLDTDILGNISGNEYSNTRTKCFPNMDRAVVRRENWAAYISMSGSRIAKYEAINGENQTGWYTGDGMVYLYTSQKDYGDAFWNGLDYYKIPGTTVTDLPRDAVDIKTSSTLTHCDFVGGCTQGDAMAVAMEFAGSSERMEFQTDLTGKKAWFFIDDMILCMGTDISCFDECDVYTVVDNRIVGEKEVLVDGEPMGESGTARRIYIPDYCGIVSYQQEMNYRIADGDDQFLQAIIDHGQAPESAGYCYAMYPLCSEEEFENVTEVDFDVIQNDGDVTAVAVKGKEFYVFWNAGTCAGITVDYPCILIVGENEISVSNPNHLQELITVTVAGETYRFEMDKSGKTFMCQIQD